MQIPSGAPLINLMASLPVQGSAATGPAASPQAPAVKAAQAALAAKKAAAHQPAASQQPQMQPVPAMTAEAHRSVANLPRGSFVNFVV